MIKSLRRAHIVVVADSNRGQILAARLRRMDVAQVTSASGFAEARGVYQCGSTDACIVVVDDALPDTAPFCANDAPGRSCGVPSLLVASVLTPFVRKAARRGGDLTVVPANIVPRMLYFRLGAAMQQRRGAPSGRRRNPGILSPPFFVPVATFGRPTLH